MQNVRFPIIDPVATGENILRLRKERGLTVKDIQSFFGFEEPQAIYKWQRGKSLPTVDNLYALGALLQVPLEQILIPVGAPDIKEAEQQAEACCSYITALCSHGVGELHSAVFAFGCFGCGGGLRKLRPIFRLPEGTRLCAGDLLPTGPAGQRRKSIYIKQNADGDVFAHYAEDGFLC